MLSQISLLLLNRIFSNNISLWIFSILLIVLAFFLRCFYKKLGTESKKLKVWRWLCFLPLAVGIVHFAFFSFRGNLWTTKYYYLWFYIGSIVLTLPALTSLWPRINKILHPLVMAFCIFCAFYTIYKPLIWDSAMRNHTRQGYVKSFIST